MLQRASADATVAALAAGAARADIEACFAQDTARTGEYLRELVRDARFREAVLWQNRGAITGAMASLLKRPPGAVDSKTREYERLVASYLQRYCAKNDTIGFFGPVGWATFDDAVATAVQRHGPHLLARRTVYFEHWAIDALAEALSGSPALRACLAPRRMPTTRVVDNVLYHPVDRRTPLPPAVARLLVGSDGTRSARAIAAALCSDADLDLSGPTEVYELLDDLVEKKLIVWRLEVPTQGFAPERALADAIGRADVGDDAESVSARDAAAAALSELVAARDAVANAAGDAEALDGAMVALEATFERLTAVSATRNAGKTYAGRRIFYEDTRRDTELVIGRAVLERAAPALTLIGHSARWFSYEIARRFETVFADVFRAQLSESPPDARALGEVDFIRFYTALQPHLSSSGAAMSATVRAVRAELHRKWSAVLGLADRATGGRITYAAATLAPAVAEAFAAPHPGWPSARHHSPDLMIAARGPDALARGECTVVLGEVHAGGNSVTLPVLAKEATAPAALHAARHSEIGQRIAMVEPRASVRRASPYSLAPGDLDLEFGDALSHRPRSEVLDVAGLYVVEVAGRLVVRHRTAPLERPLVEVLEADLYAESYAFELLPLPSSTGSPRVTIDDLVVARERWRFESPTTQLAFANAKTPLDRFVAARGFAERHGLPRFVFVKTPSEPKPMFVDFASPIFVEILCKLARGGEAVTISEMLPSLDELWLTDATGATYCAELRTVMVDQGNNA